MSHIFLDLINSQIEFICFLVSLKMCVVFQHIDNALQFAFNAQSFQIEKKMFSRLLFAILVDCVVGDWVKLPPISNTPKVSNKIQSVASFSDLHRSSVLASSDVLSSVFSYDKKISSTTDMTLISESASEKQLNTRKYMQSTVTSKSINIVDEISDRVDYTVLDKVPFVEETKTVMFQNHSMPIRIIQPVESTSKKFSSTLHEEIGEDSDDDEGVTVVDEDESLTSFEETASSEEYYEYEEASTTTTKAPRKAAKMRSKPQRRVMQKVSSKPHLHNHLNFTNFLKFLKNIQDSFATRTAKNINDKVKMLREFRDNLMMTINQRIKNLWRAQPKTKTINKNNRMKRTVHSGMGWEPGHAMDFPSAEGALLSISFLTFAVFLIKLVLQVVHTIKMKKYALMRDPEANGNVVIKRRMTRENNADDLMFSEHFLRSSIEQFEPNFIPNSMKH